MLSNKKRTDRLPDGFETLELMDSDLDYHFLIERLKIETVKLRFRKLPPLFFGKTQHRPIRQEQRMGGLENPSFGTWISMKLLLGCFKTGKKTLDVSGKQLDTVLMLQKSGKLTS